MRRFVQFGPRLGASLGLVLTLSGCAGVGNFLADTISFDTNPNIPRGDSMNMRRVQGLAAPVEAIQSEPGNVWPKGVEPLPTLQDLENEGRRPDAPRPTRPAGTPVGSVTPLPGLYQPSLYQTQTGPAAVTGGTEHYQTVNTQTGSGIALPNGNGTTTLIRADGSVETVLTPR